MRLPGIEDAFCPLHAGDGGALLRRSQKKYSCKWRRLSPPHPDRKKPARSATRWGGRSIPTASQIIRAAAILQLLLGNIGRPGGGILALRGHASIQGSTDIPTLYDILPGYLPMPFFESDSQKLGSTLKKHTSQDRLVGTTSISTSSAC